MPPPAKWFDIFQASGETTRVAIYDDIGAGEKSANDFINALNAIKTAKIDLHINSNGGEILDGLAVYNAIKDHPADVTTHIDGVAASIASLIAVAGDRVCMAKNAFVMIHSGWAKVAGDPAELRKQAEFLDKLTDSIAAGYAAKCGRPAGDIRKAMDEETWFSASEAKDYGLVDEVKGTCDKSGMASAAMLAVAKYQKPPPALRRFAASAARNVKPQAKGPSMKTIKVKYMAGMASPTVCPHCNEDLGVEVESVPQPGPVEPDAAAMAKAHDEGVKAEREYRGMFNTVVAAAKLDGPAAAEFEKTFYGRAEADLKFLASHAIGQRAKPVGEQASGNAEGEAKKDDAAKAEKAIEDKATERFNSTPDVRRMFGLAMSAGEQDPQYQTALKRYVARERQWARDQAANGTSVNSAK